MTFGPNLSQSAFFPVYTTFSDDESQRLLQHVSVTNNMAYAVNLREIALFTLEQVPTGQQWFNLDNAQIARYGFRTVVNFGSLPNNTTKSVAHNIVVDANTNFTHIWGAANNPSTKFVPIPYVNVGTPGDGIELWADATNVNIKTTTANWTAFTAVVVLEYLLN